jgi:hypothetical protein
VEIFWTFFWIVADLVLVVGASLRLVRLAIMDDLGRRALIPAEIWVRDRLPEHRQWVADGFTCPHCIGFWIGAGVVASFWLVVTGPEWGMITWRLIAGALFLNYLVGHIVASLDMGNDEDDEEEST